MFTVQFVVSKNGTNTHARVTCDPEKLNEERRSFLNCTVYVILYVFVATRQMKCRDFILTHVCGANYIEQLTANVPSALNTTRVPFS